MGINFSTVVAPIAAALLFLSSSLSLAQIAPKVAVSSGSISIGPYPVVTVLDNGTPVTTFLTALIEGDVSSEEILLRVHLFADLSEWAIKIGPIVDSAVTAEHRDNCYHPASFGNYVELIPTKSLDVTSRDSLTFKANGSVDAWYCFSNPIPETYWDPTGCNIGSVIYGCPRTRQAPDWKGMWAQQGFNAAIGIYIAQRGPAAVAFEVRDNINLTPGHLIQDSVSILSLGLIHAPSDWDRTLTSSIEALLWLIGKHPQQLLAQALQDNMDLKKMQWIWGPDLIAAGVRFDDVWFQTGRLYPQLRLDASAKITRQSIVNLLNRHGVDADPFLSQPSLRPPGPGSK